MADRLATLEEETKVRLAKLKAAAAEFFPELSKLAAKSAEGLGGKRRAEWVEAGEGREATGLSLDRPGFFNALIQVAIMKFADDGTAGPPNYWKSVFGGSAWTQVDDG